MNNNLYKKKTQKMSYKIWKQKQNKKMNENKKNDV